MSSINILPSLQRTIDECKGRWIGSELGQLVSYFLGKNFNPKQRIQHYEPCSGLAGDESYRYYVKWDSEKKEYVCGIEK